MNRILRIARREYLAYVRTFGFWLSLALLPVGLSTIVAAPLAVARSAPVPTVTVVDLTDHRLRDETVAALSAPGDGGRPAALVVPAPGGPYASAAAAADRLKRYVAGQESLPGGGRLDAAVILSPAGDTVAVDVWTGNVGDQHVQNLVSEKVREIIRRQRLEAQGVAPGALSAIEALQPKVTVFSPRAQNREVSFKDRLPAFAGLGMGLLLWMVVLTGAGMLLNSVMEEKSSRILEVLLTSASAPEIMIGKIIGVAAVTATVLAFWMTIAAVVMLARSPDIARDVAGILLSHGRWAYFALYFLGGYLMFATLYVTIGAFCETAREAQTLLGPMMIIMSVPVMFMSQAVAHPDAPLLKILAWVPLFTPFMMAARVANDPPVWEILGTGAMMAAVTAVEMWVAIPAFRTGAIATGRFDPRAFVATILRRATP